jgi:hypothetical protein
MGLHESVNDMHNLLEDSGYPKNMVDIIRYMEWFEAHTPLQERRRLFLRLYTRYDNLVRLGEANTLEYLNDG